MILKGAIYFIIFSIIYCQCHKLLHLHGCSARHGWINATQYSLFRDMSAIEPGRVLVYTLAEAMVLWRIYSVPVLCLQGQFVGWSLELMKDLWSLPVLCLHWQFMYWLEPWPDEGIMNCSCLMFAGAGPWTAQCRHCTPSCRIWRPTERDRGTPTTALTSLTMNRTATTMAIPPTATFPTCLLM